LVVVDVTGGFGPSAREAMAFAALMRLLLFVNLSAVLRASPVFMMAALISALDRLGLKDLSKPASPATCGVAMEVPDKD
jgi:hypothetical protein